ncbi:MAG: alpha-hydroxy acid oxidase [Acidimicrobiales bacterium]
MTDHPASTGGPAPTSPAVPADLDLDLMEQEARRLIGEMAYAYFAGGAEEEFLLAENTAAWSRRRLCPRILVDVARVSVATTVLGTPVRSPVMVAPTAVHDLAHPDGELATGRGAAMAGALLVLSSLATRSLEDVAAAADAAGGGPRWMQVYVLRDRGRTAELVERAAAAGYGALVLTADAPVSGLRRRERRQDVRLPDHLDLPNLDAGRTHEVGQGGFMAAVSRQFDPSLTFDDIGWLAGLAGLPVVVKGVLRADDAVRCVDAGAAAVVVSNHGARQLDDAPATADVLAGVVDAVDGRAEVYVDGGIRRAGDAAKALAMGARAVLLGRPVLWALATGGAGGVAGLLEWMESELGRVMALCGAPTVAGLDRSLVEPGVGVPGGP